MWPERKLRFGRLLLRLTVSKLATVPNSRYSSVAGPKDNAERRRASATVAAGSASVVRRYPRTATALIFLAPRTAHSPPRPAWRPSWLSVANGIRRSPAGPIAATCQSVPFSAQSRSSASRAGSPRSGPADRHSTRGSSVDIPSTKATCSVSHAPVIARASIPARLAAIAKCDAASASQTSPVSGLSATTANVAKVVSGLPTSGLQA